MCSMLLLSVCLFCLIRGEDVVSMQDICGPGLRLGCDSLDQALPVSCDHPVILYGSTGFVDAGHRKGV
jgi:hypothetical protein